MLVGVSPLPVAATSVPLRRETNLSKRIPDALGPLDLAILLDLLDLPRQTLPLSSPPVQRPSSSDEGLERSLAVARGVSSSSSGSSSRGDGRVNVDVELRRHGRDGFGFGRLRFYIAFRDGEVDLQTESK